MKCYVYNLKNLHDTIGVSLIVHCGSMNEKKTQRGFSHILEHMLISFDKFDYNPEISCFGYTDFYYTYFSFFTTKKNITTCIECIRKIINGEFITKDILENIKKDVLKEYYSIFSKNHEMEYHWLLQGTKYIEQLAIGDLEVIKNCTIAQLKEYYLKNYVSNNFELIVMGDMDNKKNGVFFDDNKKKDELEYRYCIDKFQWINYGKGHILKIYYVKSKREKNEFIYDYFFCAIVENYIREVYKDDDIYMSKILLSRTEEFFCICLPQKYINNIQDLNVLVSEIVKNIDETYLKNFFKEYKTMFFKYLSDGYGINIVNEMKICIKNLVFEDELFGTQEMNNLILNKIDNVQLDRILRMIKCMKTNEKNFHLYKILEI